MQLFSAVSSKGRHMDTRHIISFPKRFLCFDNPTEPECLSPSIKQPKTYSDCRLPFVAIANHLASISASSLLWTGLAMKSLIPA